MTIHITQIGKHRFVCGLFWQSLSRPRELAREAMELARKIDFDLMVLRKDQATAQAGFAHSREGVRRKMFSLGAAVSKTLALEGANYDGQKQPAHNWLGAFKLPDGMWAYFAVRDANFLPNGDFAGTKEEVLDRLHGDYGLGGWNVVIGDEELEEYGFHNFNARRIEDLIPKRKSGQIKTHAWWGLRPVETRIPWLAVTAVGTLSLLLAAGGYVYWKKMQQQKEEAERDRAIETARRQMQNKVASSALRHPWPTLPSPKALVDACMGKLSHITPGGWLLDEYVCTPGSVSYSWSRQNSTVDFLLSQIPNAQIDLGGDKAALVEPLSLESSGDEALLDYKNAVEPLLSKFQLLNITPRIALVPVQPPPAQSAVIGNSQQPLPKPDWQTYSIGFSAGGLPMNDVAALLGKPGIRLNKLSYRGGEWSIEGVIHVKLL